MSIKHETHKNIQDTKMHDMCVCATIALQEVNVSILPKLDDETSPLEHLLDRKVSILLETQNHENHLGN